ncbi:MAG: 50S ribosomal protein L10 [archaeon]|nr:50S ribosomal protein L10 [archaeon]
MKPKKIKVAPKKIKAVEELSKLLKENRTILIASIKNLPSSQFQEIRKKLRSKAVIRVPKKSVIIRVLEASGNQEVKKIEDQVKEDVAVLFSDLDSFELAYELIKNKSKVKAKEGQIAPENIEISEGPTDLVPGPAVSELSAMGIKIAIEGGKINIVTSKIIAKHGEKISGKACDLMSKLNIKPFSVGFEPVAAFDSKEGKLYLNINIDPEGTLKELKEAFGKALPFAVEIGYISEDTIKFMIKKAYVQEKAIESLSKEEKTETQTEVNSEGGN